jgi:glycosyltransferase involved in cell wall biosynthesis
MITVGIPTFNRSRLLSRAIDSALAESLCSELIVLDDASSDDTVAVVRSYGTRVRYVPHDKNRGPCAARNTILKHASNSWVFFLDDDDTLIPGALSAMNAAVLSAGFKSPFPVYFFSASNASVPADFQLLDFHTLAARVIRGDLVPLIHRDHFHSRGLEYPEFVVGGEGILWLRTAKLGPIPTWRICVTEVGSTAPSRITSVDYQLKNARCFAELQDRYLAEFERGPGGFTPAMAANRRLGSSAYWLLAGERRRARQGLAHSWPAAAWPLVVGVLATTFMPYSLTRQIFRQYRRILRLI